ncbi:1-acyl-sn-glycerol-3-phosphate acyltransferase [Thiopseudomonas alkaliphila]|uniref:1-acyl-sn-glycerol-3-phosphate acyltransferase n=1 Tax=Thiopseudomonas alkaliphila TaxID=1697053 RepID=UPI0009E60EDD|nr:1-acyl-sn-glycerol-3-phosphate acyltransferase [Thiopseudomonas alkaliphila]
MMGQFDDIRPYDNSELSTVLTRLLHDPEFLQAIANYRFPKLAKVAGWLIRPIISWQLKEKSRVIHSIEQLQRLIEDYIEKSIEQVTDGITLSGMEQLTADTAHLYISNHRDIVMDPALATYAMFQYQLDTPRIAIGDNLLQRPFVSDLMRLNKSFIVRRSVTGRKEKLEAFQQLSAYINHSITKDRQSVWIAQAEGRAKDGNDRTDSAILKMLHISRKDEAFSEVVQSLSLIPIAISYEYDPCDLAKARELYILATTGEYTKQPGEDDQSIALGITGYKGRVHIHFSDPITQPFTDTKALAKYIDQEIISHYRLFPVHYFAWHQWQARDQQLIVPSAEQLFSTEEVAKAKTIWAERLANCPVEHQPFLIQQYAYPVQNLYQLQQQLASAATTADASSAPESTSEHE